MSAPTLLLLPDGRLGLQTEQGPEAIQVTPCFPWSHPGQFLSLRDADGNEKYFLEDPESLDPESRKLLEHELSRGAATFQILSIQSLRKELELRCWEVHTAQGDRQFQTEHDEWPRELPDGSFLVEDLYGDLYRVAPLNQLDPHSRKLFWPLIG